MTSAEGFARTPQSPFSLVIRSVQIHWIGSDASAIRNRKVDANEAYPAKGTRFKIGLARTLHPA